MIKIRSIKNKSTSALLIFSLLKWIIIGSVVGLITGSVLAFFLNSLEFVTAKRIKYPWLLFLLPLGGAFVSFIYLRYGKNSNKGNNLIIEKVNKCDCDIPLRMAPLVFLGTIITHLFGGSAGREGTGVQIGASISQFVGKIFKLDKEDSRIILMSGISSGFSSIFGTPIAGTIFGLEISSLGTMSYESLVPCFIASFVGNLTTIYLGIHHEHYSIGNVMAVSYIGIIKVIFAAILFGLTSKLFSELTHKLKNTFSKFCKDPMIKSLFGGIIIILLVFILNTRDYIGLSTPLINQAFKGSVSPLAFLWKILFTSVTLGSGFQGGEVTPLFVIGSTLGNTLSSFLHVSAPFFAALGLIGVFTGATNTPISSFILSIELFGSQGIIYMFITCIISYVFSGHTGVYTSQRIGRSKSKLLKVPEHTTISSYRKKSE